MMSNPSVLIVSDQAATPETAGTVLARNAWLNPRPTATRKWVPETGSGLTDKGIAARELYRNRCTRPLISKASTWGGYGFRTESIRTPVDDGMMLTLTTPVTADTEISLISTNTTYVIPATPGDPFTYAYAVRNDGDESVTIGPQVYARNASGGSIAVVYDPVAYTILPGDTAVLSVSGVVPAGAVDIRTSIRAGGVRYGAIAAGARITVLDGITYVDAPALPGPFHGDLSPDPTRYGVAWTGTVGRSESILTDGIQAQLFELGTLPAPVALLATFTGSDPVRLTAGTWTIGVWLRTNIAAGALRLSPGGSSFQVQADLTGGEEWELHSKTITLTTALDVPQLTLHHLNKITTKPGGYIEVGEVWMMRADQTILAPTRQMHGPTDTGYLTRWAGTADGSVSEYATLIPATPAQVRPELILGWESKRTTGVQVHPLQASVGVAVTAGPAGLRTGTLSMLILTEEDATAAERMLCQPSTFTLIHEDRPGLGMRFVVPDPGVSLKLDDETREVWELTCEFQEVR